MRGIIAPGALCAMLMSSPCLAADVARPAAPAEPVAISGTKKTVMFDHSKGHKDIDCVVCHHRVDGKPTFAKCGDAGCHDDLTARKGEKSLYFVMHSKSGELRHQSCMSCHAKTVAAKPELKKDMTGCAQSWCHPAQKKADS